MPYLLFYTDVPGVTKSQYKAQKARLTPYRYNDRDDALGMARKIESLAGAVWEIERDDGSAIHRDQIQTELLARATELANRPRVR